MNYDFGTLVKPFMKHKYFFLVVCSAFFAAALQAQTSVITLQHNGGTSVFYGQSAFSDGYNAAVNGDTLYLSAGYFSAPSSIAKGLKVIGSGHFPDSEGAILKRTTILSGLNINAGADNLSLEGMYINGDINYQGNSSINHVKVKRCRLNNISFNSASTAASKNNCSFIECYIGGRINFSHYGNDFSICNSVIGRYDYVNNMYRNSSILNIDGSALIKNNIVLGDQDSLIYINGSIIENNIFKYPIFFNSNNNHFSNNLFVSSDVNFGSNSALNNTFGILQASLFVNPEGSSADYTQDYHLKIPTAYLGTDSTQVGIYGGETPFKDSGTPSNPQITKMVITNQTDANGNLKVSFTVKAQDR